MNFRARVSGFLFFVIASFSAFGGGQTTNSITGTWVENNPGGTGCPALEIDADNRPTVFSLTQVAPPHGTSDFTLYALQQYVQDAPNSEWKNDFPIYNLNQRELVTSPSVSLNGEGAAFLSWVETKQQYGEPSIVVGRRVGASEQHYLFGIDPTKDAFAVSSKLDEQGNPVVAWSEGLAVGEMSSGQVALDYLKQAYYPRDPQREEVYSDTMTYVRHWDGTAWQDVGTPLEGHNPALVLDKQGAPYVIYVRTVAEKSELVVVYWDGEGWKQIGDAISDSLLDNFRSSSLVFDDEEMPIVAVMGLDENGVFDLIVKKWDGSSWQRLGEDSSKVEGYNPLAVSLDYRAGKLVVASIEVKPQTSDFEPPQTLFVKEWNGDSWQLLGAEVSSNAACPVVKLDDQGNPVVAWSQILDDGLRDLSAVVKLSHFVRE